MPTFIGPWVENSEGGREVEVTAIGSGPLVVLRNGVAITGTWTRQSLTGPATLVSLQRHPDHPPARQHLGGACAPGRPGHHHGGARAAGHHDRPRQVDHDHHQGLRPGDATGAPRRRSAAGERPTQVVEGGDGRVLADPVPVARHGELRRL